MIIGLPQQVSSVSLSIPLGPAPSLWTEHCYQSKVYAHQRQWQWERNRGREGCNWAEEVGGETRLGGGQDQQIWILPYLIRPFGPNFLTKSCSDFLQLICWH